MPFAAIRDGRHHTGRTIPPIHAGVKGAHMINAMIVASPLAITTHLMWLHTHLMQVQVARKSIILSVL